MSFSDDELQRYARHIVLKEVGGAGQAAFAAGHVVLVGAGGIGAPAVLYLAAAGVGRITVIDDDRVDRSNLQRQILYDTDSLGAEKAAVARDVVHRLNPHVAYRAHATRLVASNAIALLGGADVVIDGSDGFATRLAVADACHRLRIPLVSASVAQFEGQLAVYRGWDAGLPCYRCFVGSDPERDGVSCADVGVLGALAGVMGSLGALEALRALHPFGDDPAGKLLLVDALSLRFRTIALPKDPGCPTCAG